ncbi:hypothetical protein [Methylobacterium sp. J-068]|uniref:hypothetical protein n=1 Tax=Methylobacterium sp. J-068 TaxID=2836649 RepID=UPI001FBA13E2|nr:hypothetical protein [Methylobacterium sp. J-068]MCJ2035374.1 hypothetical protein [Methylobacterium sp. J-068]
MSVLRWMGQVDEAVLVCLVLATLIAVAVACAPTIPPRRLPALAKRMRDTGRY